MKRWLLMYNQVFFGLGVGMLLAGVMVLAFANGQLSQTEIISQARVLGMVFRQEVIDFDDAGQPEDPPAVKDQPDGPQNSVIKESTQADKDNNDGAKVATPTDRKPGQSVAVTIPRGVTLTEVANILADSDIVTAQQFLDRAAERAVSQKIIAGGYQLPANGDVDAIIDIITTQ